MYSLSITVLLASLLGSMHCLGMCGAFVAIASSGTGSASVQFRRQSFYHLGRLITYSTLGLIAGTAGSMLNLTSFLSSVAPPAAILAGLTVALFGLLHLLRFFGVSSVPVHLNPLPRSVVSRLVSAQRAAMSLPPDMRAMSLGLATTLLPCGWLWIFVAVAAGTASTISGLLVMSVFWLGTLPALTVLGMAARWALGRSSKFLPAATAFAMIFMGLFTLSNRSLIDIPALAAAAQLRSAASDSMHPAHSTSPAVNHPAEADLSSPPPCCHP